MFGVITLASGKSSSTNARFASSLINADPLVDTMTGSSTTRSAPQAFSPSAMECAMAADDTMPILTASGRMSENTASTCPRTKEAGMSKTSFTPSVFWAVKAVMTVWANEPSASMVLMSACIPAPPELSEPAMLTTEETL